MQGRTLTISHMNYPVILQLYSTVSTLCVSDVSLVGEIEFDTEDKDIATSELDGLNERLGQAGRDIVEMVWFQNVIYVICHSIPRLRKYRDCQPFDQLPGEIEVEVYDPMSMVACERNQSIYISDADTKCIVKIQMPNESVERWQLNDGQEGPISTIRNRDLILLVNSIKIPGSRERQCWFQFLKSENGEVTRTTQLPREIQYYCYVVESPDGNFVITYSTSGNCRMGYKIGVLSSDGQNLIHAYDLGRSALPEYNPFQFTFYGLGQIFIPDYVDKKVALLNSQSAVDRVVRITESDVELIEPMRVVYVPSKQLLLVQDYGYDNLTTSAWPRVYSPCVLVLKLEQIEPTAPKQAKFDVSPKKCPDNKKRPSEAPPKTTTQVPRKSCARQVASMHKPMIPLLVYNPVVHV